MELDMMGVSQLRFGLIVGLAALSGAALAQTADKKDKGPWDVSVGLGVAYAPEYEGASKRVAGVVPDFNVSYKTDSYGTFAVGSKAKGFSWTAIDKEEYSLGVSLGLDGGRVDNKDGGGLRTGSKRLRGMGEIKSSLDYGVFGHVTVGVPISLQIIKNAGDGKVNNDRKIDGSGGTRVELSVELPWQISDSVGLSFSPNIVWADKKYTQTYFGVTSAQAANSGFKAYNAKGGIKSAGLAVGANYKFTPHWSANVGVSFNRLQGDAAKSPLVQTKNQTSVAAGVAYTF
jgi:MipA family protein